MLFKIQKYNITVSEVLRHSLTSTHHAFSPQKEDFLREKIKKLFP